MACLAPLIAWSLGKRGGKTRLVFRAPVRSSRSVERLLLPCGVCDGCKIRRAYEWSVRIMCEAQMHERCCFLTLTYSSEFLPPGGVLVLDHIQGFIRELRRVTGKKLRYYQCGEYGDQFGRPHFHMCLFGEDFSYDRVPFGRRSHTSPSLDRIWGKGHVRIDELTAKSAGYVAGYVQKKLYGDKWLRAWHYGGKPEEFSTMSRRPGIGKAWFEKFLTDVYPSDMVVSVDGSTSRPPRRFDEWLKEVNPRVWGELQDLRLADADGVLREHPDADLRALRIVADSRKRVGNKRDGGF